MLQRILLYVTVSFLCNAVFSREKEHDSLMGKNFDYLYSRIEANTGKKEVWPYLNAYLRKAKINASWEEAFNAYHYILYEAKPGERLIYADSMIYAAEKTDKNGLIGSAYLTKGILYYNEKDHNLALDNYLIANRYISTTKDPYLSHKVKYNIAHIKYYLGFYNEAVSLFKDCVNYFDTEDKRAYINSLHSLALCYNRLGQIKESIAANDFAISECTRLDKKEMMPYMKQLEGVNYFYTSDYRKAISTINKTLSDLRRDDDFANEAVGLFYMGKSYWKLGNYEQAVSCYKHVDRIFLEKEYIRPDLRQNYEMLIKYYKDKDDLEKQLHYINRLLEVDQMMDTSYKYLSSKIHKEYDASRLIEAKNEIERELQSEKMNDIIFLGVIIILILILAYFIYYHFSTKKRYKRNFGQMMAKKDMPVSEVATGFKAKAIGMNPDVVTGILKKLAQFENEKLYLNKEITASSLADSFDTNYKYLTKVIHHCRKKKFTTYLNDLRIEHIILQLQNDPKLRLYANSGLADEAGFSTTQRFTQAFKKKAGMSPTFFVNELNKGSQKQ